MVVPMTMASAMVQRVVPAVSVMVLIMSMMVLVHVGLLVLEVVLRPVVGQPVAD
jgi:hypothetical protein